MAAPALRANCTSAAGLAWPDVRRHRQCLTDCLGPACPHLPVPPRSAQSCWTSSTRWTRSRRCHPTSFHGTRCARVCRITRAAARAGACGSVLECTSRCPASTVALSGGRVGGIRPTCPPPFARASALHAYMGPGRDAEPGPCLPSVGPLAGTGVVGPGLAAPCSLWRAPAACGCRAPPRTHPRPVTQLHAVYVWLGHPCLTPPHPPPPPSSVCAGKRLVQQAVPAAGQLRAARGRRTAADVRAGVVVQHVHVDAQRKEVSSSSNRAMCGMGTRAVNMRLCRLLLLMNSARCVAWMVTAAVGGLPGGVVGLYVCKPCIHEASVAVRP